MKHLLFFCFVITIFSPVTNGQSDKLQKGRMRLSFSGLTINNMVFNGGDSVKLNTGIFGLALGVQYVIRNDQFLELSAGAASTKVLLPDLDEGPYQARHSIFFRVTRNHVHGRFIAGYGMHYSINQLLLRYKGLSVPASFDERTITQQGLGIALTGKMFVWELFYLGVQYHPIILDIRNIRGSKYRHLYSLEAGVMLKLW